MNVAMFVLGLLFLALIIVSIVSLVSYKTSGNENHAFICAVSGIFSLLIAAALSVLTAINFAMTI